MEKSLAHVPLGGQYIFRRGYDAMRSFEQPSMQLSLLTQAIGSLELGLIALA